VQGFQTEVRSGIVLTVGREAVVDLAMSVGATTQSVEVAGEAALINTTSSTVQGLVSGEQIRELPLNGRSYNDLALLNPGVIYNRTTGSSSTDGFGVRMSVNGARSNNNLYLIDGTVTNDTSQTAGTVNADSLGVEGIREFSVLTHNYGAEFGHSAGGVVNAVTRTGTNQFHGSLYEFLRNSDLDARDFFQPGSIAPFHRNQFGGAIGGPVKKDKIFFFSNYEGFRQSLTTPVVGNVPNLLARQGTIPINGVLTNVGVSSKIAPYLALYALPNGIDNGDGTAQWIFGFKQPINENYNMERADFLISTKDNLYVRYIFDPSDRLRPSSDPYWTSLDNATNHFAQIGETHIFSPNAINDFRVAFNRTDRHTAIGPVNSAISSLITPSMSFVPGMPLGRLNFSGSNSGAASSGGGLEVMGILAASPTIYIQNLFEEGDTFTLIRGGHSFKFGADLERYQTQNISGSNTRAGWLFGGLQSFLTAQPVSMDGAKLLGPIPGGGNSVEEFGWRQWLPAWFVLDDWRVNSRLTLNLGLRQEFFTDPREVNGLSAALVNLTDAASTVGAPYHSAKMNFAPRFGLAWDPTGSGKTSIRGGIGTYYNQVNIKEAGPPADYRFAANYTLNCNWTSATNPCATFPYMPASPPLSTSKSETAVQYRLPTPTVIQYGIDIQRQLTNSMSIRVGYVGWHGYNLTATIEANDKFVDPATGLYNTAGAVKPNPGFGTIAELAGVAVANYNGLQVDFRKALSAGLTFQMSYTYSKTLSDADSSNNRVTDNTGTGYVPLDPLNLLRDYGRSAYDQRHVIVINSQYELPLDKYLNGRWAKALIGGWFVNGIWQFGSGLPLNVGDGFNNSGNGDPVFPDRPNVNPGFSNNPISGSTAGCGGVVPAGQPVGTPNRWFDPCAFSLNPAGTYGNLGKNTLNGPRTDQLNLALAKNFAITERIKLQFRTEAFNLLNHAQFGLPSLPIFQSNRTYSGSAGVITSTAGTPGLGGRNVQFGMKLTF
jgi:hypothetical protein